MSSLRATLAHVVGTLCSHNCCGCLERPVPHTGAALCGACRRSLTWHTGAWHGAPQSADVAACVFVGPLRAAVHAAKFAGEAAAWAGLAKVAWHSGAVQQALASADACTFVPSHRGRLWARGFEHAGLLAAALATRAGRPLLRALVKARATPPQSSLPAAARAANVAGAFVAARPLPLQHVVLVDDVATTGATLRAATRALLAGGAKRVTTLCLATAPPSAGAPSP